MKGLSTSNMLLLTVLVCAVLTQQSAVAQSMLTLAIEVVNYPVAAMIN